MRYTLQKATKKDFDYIYYLKKLSIQPYVEKIWGWDEQYQLDDFTNDFKAINSFNLIMVEDNKAGFLQVMATEKNIYIVEIHLAEQFQGKGFGTAIIRKIIAEAKNSSKNILLGCFKDNVKAKKLYLKMGFSIVEETESHYKFQFTNSYVIK